MNSIQKKAEKYINKRLSEMHEEFSGKQNHRQLKEKKCKRCKNEFMMFPSQVWCRKCSKILEKERAQKYKEERKS